MIRQVFAAASAALSVASAQVERTSFDTGPFSFGTLTQADGALSQDLWQGSDAALVEDLLESVPVRFDDPVKRMMLRRVLLSPGEGPDGAGAELAGLKLLRAAEAGYVFEAGAVAELMPGLAAAPALSRIVAMRDLYAGDIERACQRGANLREGRQRPFFVRLRAFCYLQAGERPAAELTISLAREEGLLSPEDEQLFRLLMTGGAPTTLPQGALGYAAFRVSGGLLDEEDVPVVAPAVAAAMVMDGGLSVAARRAALDRAVMEGLLGGRDLGRAAAEMPGTTLGDELAALDELEDGSPERAGAIGEALATARDKPADFLLRVRILAADIASLGPDIATVPYAAEFALASLLNRRFGDAERWMQTVAAEQSFDAERAFLNLARLYAYLEPSAAQRLAGAIGETINELDVAPIEAADAAAQATKPGDLALNVELALGATASGSRAAQLLAALGTASVDADTPELARIRDTLAANLYARTDGAAFAREAAFWREALANAGRLRSEVIGEGPYVPRLKPERAAQ